MGVEHQESLESKIEQIRTLPIGTATKAELVLVLLDQKPATNITFSKERISADEMESALRDIGLAPVVRNETDDHVEIIASQSSEISEELARLSPTTDHRRFGELMGFPESAIEAFSNPESRLSIEETAELLKDLPVFGQLALSKEHSTEEVERTRSWNLAILEHAPGLLDETYGVDGAARYKEYLTALKERSKR